MVTVQYSTIAQTGQWSLYSTVQLHRQDSGHCTVQYNRTGQDSGHCTVQYNCTGQDSGHCTVQYNCTGQDSGHCTVQYNCTGQDRTVVTVQYSTILTVIWPFGSSFDPR